MSDVVITGSRPQPYLLVRDPIVTFPELYMEVYVAGDSYEQEAFARWMVQADCLMAESPEEADIVIFTGGADVNPDLYGASYHHTTTSYDDERDAMDMQLFATCVEKGIPMLGICRGAQFGWVMHGGKLFQDVDNHYGDHNLWVQNKAMLYPVSSVHHQMVVPDDTLGAETLAYARASRKRVMDKNVVETGMIDDIEAFWFPETGFLGVQGHPEYPGYPDFAKWVFQQINELFLENPDFELRDNLRRLKKEVIDNRSYKFDDILKNMNVTLD